MSYKVSRLSSNDEVSPSNFLEARALTARGA